MQVAQRGFVVQLLKVIPRRPALLTALLLIAGILLHRRLPMMPAVWSVLAGGCLVLSARTYLRQTGLMAALLFVGVALAQLEHFYYARSDIGAFASDAPRLAQLELYVSNPPRLLVQPYGTFHALPPKQVTTATVRQIKTWDGWKAASGDILVQIDQPHPRLAQGQVIRVLGLLQRPGPAMNPGQFDWAGYYREQRVLASLHVPRVGNIQILESHWPGILARMRERARQLLAMGFAPQKSLDHALLRALLLGDNDPELRDVQDEFRRTGTSHHLSISGMHVAVLGGLVYLLCRILCLHPRWSAAITLAFVLLYGAVTLPSPPIMRAMLLCSAITLGMLARRSIDSIQLLAVCALAMVLYHPLDVYNAGFQLSFLTVFGLMVGTRPVLDWMNHFKDRDMEIAAQLQPPRGWFVWWRDRKRNLYNVLAAGLVAWFVSFPLIAYHFEQLNPYAVLAGLILFPFVVVGLVGGLLKVLFTALWPGMAGGWAILAGWPMLWMRHGVDWLAKLPRSDVPLPSPPIWLIVAYYVLLAATGIALWKGFGRQSALPESEELYAVRRRPGWFLRWYVPAAPVVGCLMVAFLPGWLRFAPQSTLRGELKVTLLSLGAGQCAVVEAPGAGPMLVDCGSSSLPDLLRKCIGPFLRHEGWRTVDTILLSHGDYDHISAAGEAVTAYDVQHVLMSPYFKRHAEESAPAETLLETLDHTDHLPTLVAAGDHLPLGSGAALDVLWPPRDGGGTLSSNNAGIVLRLTYAGRSVLFPADIQAVPQSALLKHATALKSDVLVAAHHGSSESTTAAFVNAVNPAFVVSSNDRTLTQKQVRFDGIVAGRALYRTSRWGAVTVRISASGEVHIEPYLQRPQP